MRDLTPAERSMRARMAAHAMHSKNDSRVTSQPGRDAFLKRFVNEVHAEAAERGEALTDPVEIMRRAGQKRSAYMTNLAYKSARARATR